MARIDSFNNYFTDVANAIRAKEGSTEVIPAAEFDTRIANLAGVNGIKKTGTAQTIINKGDFIKYERVFDSGSGTLNSTSLDGLKNAVIHLYDNKFFIAYADSNYNVAAVIGTVDNYNNFTLGTSVVVSTGDRPTYMADSKIVAEKIGKNKILIAYSNSQSTPTLTFSICNINGNTITVEKTEIVDTTTNSGYIIKMIAVSPRKIFLINRNSNYETQINLFTIYENTITKKVTTSLPLIEDAALIEGEKIAIVYSSSSVNTTKLLKYCQVNVSDLTLDSGQLELGTGMTKTKIRPIDSDSYIIFYANGSGQQLMATLWKRNPSTSKKNTVTISTAQNAAYSYEALITSDKKHFICAYTGGSSYTSQIWRRTGNINGDTLEISSILGSSFDDSRYAGYNITLMEYKDCIIFAHRYTSKYKFEIQKYYKNQIKKVTANEAPNGVAKTSASISSNVDVILNDYENSVDLSVTGSNYGFYYQNGWYYSNNKEQNNSYSKCRVNIRSAFDVKIAINALCVAENNSYDYGIIGNVDQVLSDSNTADTTYMQLIKSNATTSISNISWTIPGDGKEHFVEFKYRKDSSSHSKDDCFKFRYDIDTN